MDQSFKTWNDMYIVRIPETHSHVKIFDVYVKDYRVQQVGNANSDDPGQSACMQTDPGRR